MVRGWTSPVAISLDQAGNVYVGDHYIQKLTLSGGSYTKSVYSTLIFPVQGIAVDALNTVYAVNANGDLAMDTYRFGSENTTYIDSNDPNISSPYALALSANDLYIADSGNSNILKMSNDFHSVNVGSTNTSNQKVTALFTYHSPSPGQLGGIIVTTDGNTQKDFTDAGTGTCSLATVYNPFDSCTVDLAFTPSAPGVRHGAVTITDSAGNAISPAVIVTGTGVGPVADFLPGVLSINQHFSSAAILGLTADANGNLYATDSVNDAIWEYAKGAGWSQLFNAGSGLKGVAVDEAGELFYSLQGAHGEFMRPLPFHLAMPRSFSLIRTSTVMH